MKKLNILFFLLVFALFFSCKDEEKAPENPYDKVDYGTSVVENDTLDKNSIAAIHRDILQVKCATPGCHDGSFEPDFRTVMSSYSTLVYHPIKKNNVAESFKYRVIPNDAAQSVLYERITNIKFVNQNDRMPQDNIGVGLPQADIDRIKTWINNGAKDFTGFSPKMPNNEPVYQWIYALVDEGFPLVYDSEVVSDENSRVGGIGYNSMMLKPNFNYVLSTTISDDLTPISDLVNSRLLFSYDKDDFSNPIKTVYPTYLNYGTGELWYNKFSTSGFTSGVIVYMRYYTNDGSQTIDSEVPNQTSQEWLKSYWSFIVQ